MVCIYCAGETKVSNSREQKRLNQTWRRRNCLSCCAIFTTLEAAAWEQAFVVQSPETKQPQPFSRDKLFLSIYESLKHRPTALSNATALTNTVIAKLLSNAQAGSLERADIINTTEQTLKHFDKPAAVYYAAYHHTSSFPRQAGIQ